MRTRLSTPEPFEYTRLDPYKPQIRLLQLERASGQVCCCLNQFNLDALPRYRALSYTWGPDRPKQSVLINGKTFQVGKNLFDFLTRAFENGISEKTYIWIDQICIDQSNTHDAIRERNDQVSRMDKIYASAEQVDVWLGVGSSDVENYLKSMSSSRDLLLPNVWHPGYRAFESLPYWSRAWVVQEMYLAKRLRFIYGTSSLRVDGNERRVPFSRFATSIQLVRERATGELNSVWDRDQSTSLTRIATSPLLNLKCSRVHDRLYAFQALFDEQYRVDVNYEWTPAQLFDALMDKLALASPDQKYDLNEFEAFANRLDITPTDFSRTLRRLKKEGKIIDASRMELDMRERSYSRWAPKFNPECRRDRTWMRKFWLRVQDVKQSGRPEMSKPYFPDADTWHTKHHWEDEYQGKSKGKRLLSLLLCCAACFITLARLLKALGKLLVSKRN